MKQLRTSEYLVNHLEEKGVKFNIISKEEAITFLEEKNYYMKLASYRNNYHKNKKGKYINLEFAYLKDLSSIDMHLRYIIIQMTLDIEHFIKVRMLNHIERNDYEDGYNIIKKFLNEGKNFNKLRALKKRTKSGSYAKELIDKYHPYYPVWVFVEIISFGDLLYLYNFYSKIYKIEVLDNKILNNIRDLRNAAAHSNCLIYDLKSTRKKYNGKWDDINVINLDLINKDFSKNTRKNKLSNRFMKDFICLLYGYNYIVPDGSLKNKRISDLNKLFEDRMLRNKDYYNSNEIISSSYIFASKYLDSFK